MWMPALLGDLVHPTHHRKIQRKHSRKDLTVCAFNGHGNLPCPLAVPGVQDLPTNIQEEKS